MIRDDHPLTVFQELQIYIFARLYSGKTMDRTDIEKMFKMSYDFFEKETHLDIYVIKSTNYDKVKVKNFIATSISDFLHIPDDQIIPFYRIGFSDADEEIALVEEKYIPFWMLGKYGGFIPEFPKIFQNLMPP
jgi:hypothetical protein